ncbi:hypothetical protein F8M41_015709 [Gigaspora margarita]|uniref:Uncharacterized protein n=1 Tax=Gigaspora margarita TaxID=4874 RepID=A0A8H3ZZ85_GIGMA|nr:hypothetical protein F8M41_015709 [Gigaspora margarita]
MIIAFPTALLSLNLETKVIESAYASFRKSLYFLELSSSELNNLSQDLEGSISLAISLKFCKVSQKILKNSSLLSAATSKLISFSSSNSNNISLSILKSFKILQRFSSFEAIWLKLSADLCDCFPNLILLIEIFLELNDLFSEVLENKLTVFSLLGLLF